MSYTVYMHICPNGKKYVGITCQEPKKRWGSKGSRYYHNTHFTNAIKKYGWDNIEHKIMANWCTKEYAQLWEKRLIESYRTTDSRYGYNKTYGGETNIPNDETRQKISESNKGRKLSEGTKQKMSQSKKGSIMSEDNKKKLFLANKGRRMSEETKGKLSLAKKNMYKSEKSKERLYKSVIQFNLDGEYIQIHKSIKQATIVVKGKSNSRITECCKGRQKTAYGYIWKYAEEQT